MTAYDAAMAGVIVAGMVWGAFKGVTWQVASILSLVLGYTVSHTLSGQAAAYFPGEPVVARALAMIALYLGTSGVVFLGAWLIRATLKKLQFEAFDRHLGMLLGGLEGALIGMVVTLFVVSLAPQTREPIFQSHAGRIVGTVMSAVGPVLPAEARQVLAPFLSPHAPTPEAASLAEEPAPDPAPAPVTRTASRATGGVPTPSAAPRAASVRESASDPSATPASFSELLEESEKRIGKAVLDGAASSLKKAVKGGAGNGDRPNRATERR